MNIFNRLLAIIFFLVVLALAIGTIGIVTGLMTVRAVDRVHYYAPVHRALSDLHAVHPQQPNQALVVLGAALVGVVCLLFLTFELKPPRRERRLLLEDSEDGAVTIGYKTMQKVAEQASLGVPGVDAADCAVSRQKEALTVRCKATIDRFANGEIVGSRVEDAIKRQLEQTLGLPVERVDVRVEPETASAPVRVR